MVVRLKSDWTAISDLPEKTEVKAYCQLIRKHAARYQDSVHELRDRIAAADGARRKGLIFPRRPRRPAIAVGDVRNRCAAGSGRANDGEHHDPDSLPHLGAERRTASGEPQRTVLLPTDEESPRTGAATRG